MEDTHKEAGGVVAGALDIETHSMCHKSDCKGCSQESYIWGFSIIFSEAFLGGFYNRGQCIVEEKIRRREKETLFFQKGNLTGLTH